VISRSTALRIGAASPCHSMRSSRAASLNAITVATIVSMTPSTRIARPIRDVRRLRTPFSAHRPAAMGIAMDAALVGECVVVAG